MNFFERQHQAKRKTTLLVGLFLLASLGIIVVVDGVLLWFFGRPAADAGQSWIVANTGLLLTGAVITALVILGASAFKIASLRSGGGAVARGLGAQPVPAEPSDFPRQQLRNVVEEVAIASGMPVPEIFVLERESAINAFAAGNSPADAAVAVTRGAMERLNREELQGVIAHEFSHVANGDMRLNLKLMGWVFGILVLALAGRTMLYSMRFSSNRKGNALAMLGLALVVAGFVGLFFGRLIKAAVSRERERLADASAVQFTRNPTGLAGALKKIGGYEAGSSLQHTDTEEVSHMLFAASLSGWFSKLYATHPPLVERIRALEPGFDPEQSEGAPPTPGPAAAAPEPVAPLRQAGLAPALLAAAAGQPEASHLDAASALYRHLPASARAAARDGDQATLLVIALMLDEEPRVRGRQMALLDREWDASARERVSQWSKELSGLGAAARLPLLELAWPALKALPPERLGRLEQLVAALGRADERVSVFEYALGRMLRVLIADLKGADPTGGRLKLRDVHQELGDLFSVLAAAGHRVESRARHAFAAGMESLIVARRPEYGVPRDWQRAVDGALDRLDRLAPLTKQGLVQALAITCAHDGLLKVPEAELLRAVCLSLHCPLPPLPLEARG